MANTDNAMPLLTATAAPDGDLPLAYTSLLQIAHALSCSPIAC
jgi:hypothetical protein